MSQDYTYRVGAMGLPECNDACPQYRRGRCQLFRADCGRLCLPALVLSWFHKRRVDSTAIDASVAFLDRTYREAFPFAAAQWDMAEPDRSAYFAAAEAACFPSTRKRAN
jgi:hypothetical protein